METRPRQRQPRRTEPRIRAKAPDARHNPGVHAPGGGRLGRRGRPPPDHHTIRGDARRCQRPHCRAASRPAAHRGRTPIPDRDATCEVWFERDGQPIGAGRASRRISRRLRRALEHRHPTCAVPGCGATRGLHAHHIRHWKDGGPTELDNLVLVRPYHHRLHHRGVITITIGPAHHLNVTYSTGRALSAESLARHRQDPARRRAPPRLHRRTRPLVVVRPLPAPTTTDKQLICGAFCQGAG